MGVSFSMVILILLVVSFKRNKIAHFLKWSRCRPICRPKDAELGDRTESTMLEDTRAPASVEVKGGTNFLMFHLFVIKMCVSVNRSSSFHAKQAIVNFFTFSSVLLVPVLFS